MTKGNVASNAQSSNYRTFPLVIVISKQNKIIIISLIEFSSSFVYMYLIYSILRHLIFRSTDGKQE